MKITHKALELTKRFAAGAPCKIDFRNIENTMFWPHYEAIAMDMGLNEINEAVVKKYWFKVHNEIVFNLFKKGDYGKKEAHNCMVRIGKKGNKLFCFHGGKAVCVITQEEANTIRTPKL